jgi:phosphatidylglycerol:prolipoprotein diacylglycerol transferase
MQGFLNWWQHLPENIDPYIVEIGSFRIGWYGMMYVVAFVLAYLLSLHRIKHEEFGYTKETLQDFLVWAAAGLILGARVGYVLFYNLDYYLDNPLEIFLPFSIRGGFRFTGISGMSYHGGLIGTLIAGGLFLRRRRMGFWSFTDFFIPVIPLGYTFGRLGNFINSELYGRATSVPWGMYFPSANGESLRHPSQLYEAFFEGIVLFAVLWPLRKRVPFTGFYLALYLMGYGTARFFIEFVREPDSHLGLVLGPMSMGQVLSSAMILGGAALMAFRWRAARPG